MRVRSNLLIFTLFIGISFPYAAQAETVELITYYPAQANLGEANLENASIGNLPDEPGPGELFVENRMRIGEPGLYDPTESKLSMFSTDTNVSSSFIHMQVTEPIPTTLTNQDMRILTASKRNAADNVRLDWTMTMGAGDTPGISFFRAHRPDSGANTFETPLYLAWNNRIGIGNITPEAMLHVGSMSKPGSILIENNQGIRFRDNAGATSTAIEYNTSNELVIGQTDVTRSVIFKVGPDPSVSIAQQAATGDILTTIHGDLIVEGEIRDGNYLYIGSGDVDGSGAITPLDVLHMINLGNSGFDQFSNQDWQRRADIDGDASITSADIVAVIDQLNRGGGLIGDGLLKQGSIIKASLLARKLRIDASNNVGVGQQPQSGAFPNPHPQGFTSGMLTTTDVYLSGTGQWASQLGGNNAPDFDSGWFAATTNGRYAFPHTLSGPPKHVQMFCSNNPGGAYPIYIVSMMNNNYDNGYNVEIRANEFVIYTGDYSICVMRGGTGSNPHRFVIQNGYYRFLAWE